MQNRARLCPKTGEPSALSLVRDAGDWYYYRAREGQERQRGRRPARRVSSVDRDVMMAALARACPGVTLSTLVASLLAKVAGHQRQGPIGLVPSGGAGAGDGRQPKEREGAGAVRGARGGDAGQDETCLGLGRARGRSRGSRWVWNERGARELS